MLKDFSILAIWNLIMVDVSVAKVMAVSVGMAMLVVWMPVHFGSGL